MTMRESDMVAFICNDCQYINRRVVVLIPKNVVEENLKKGLKVKFCPYCGKGDP